MDPQEMLDACRPAFHQLLDKYGINSAALGILKDGKIYCAGVGHHGASMIPNKDTVFLISSMSKPILAAAIGVLVSQDMLKLETPVGDVLPELRHRSTCKHRGGRALRVVDLLDHRSEFFRSDRLWEGTGGRVNIQKKGDVLELYDHLPLNKACGDASSFSGTRNYNNLCYGVLAMIIEKTTGKPWAEFVHKNVFDPLGMSRSTADLSIRNAGIDNVAGAYCADIDADACRSEVEMFRSPGAALVSLLAQTGGRGNRGDIFRSATPQEIRPSKCTDKATYVGAGTGLRSTVKDLLKFYQVVCKLHGLKSRGGRRGGSSGGANIGSFGRIERGILAVLDHVQDMAKDPTCAYAGGWNTVNLPWDGQQRAPGADGENYKRLEAAAKLLKGEGRKDGMDPWPFLTDPMILEHTRKTGKPVMTQASNGLARTPALFHGGNMVGATSSALLAPSLGFAVVALCDSRSFYVDVANLAVMALADNLFRRSNTEKVMNGLKLVHSRASRCAAMYMLQVGQYEARRATELQQERPTRAGTAQGSPGVQERHHRMVGKYNLTPGRGIFVDVREADGRLEMRPQGADRWYALRARKQDGTHGDDAVTMSYAMPVKELHATGLGGSIWLNHQACELTFYRDSGGHGGGFDRLLWGFEDFDGRDEHCFFYKE